MELIEIKKINAKPKDTRISVKLDKELADKLNRLKFELKVTKYSDVIKELYDEYIRKENNDI